LGKKERKRDAQRKYRDPDAPRVREATVYPVVELPSKKAEATK